MLIPPSDITGVVLCGGEARRMGGANKPLLDLFGRPLVAHVLERLTPQVGHVIISANRAVDDYRAFAHPVITDDSPGLGPLGGLASVAAQVSTPWMFCCPGDAPRLAPDVVSRLGAAWDEQSEAVYPHDGERPQYLFLLVRPDALGSLGEYLESGRRSVHGWLEAMVAQAVAMPEIAESFTNVNSSDALVKLRTDN